MDCSKVQSTCIVNGQYNGLSALVESSKDTQLSFFISNNMHDETKLPMCWPRTRMTSVLAWHSQATWGEGLGHVPKDADVIRPPRKLHKYNAAVL